MLDIKRSGYDNLSLVAGYDWQAKLSVALGDAAEQWSKNAQTLAANFDKLDKADVVVVAKWENEVLHACGMKGKSLPVVTKPKAASAFVSIASAPAKEPTQASKNS